MPASRAICAIESSAYECVANSSAPQLEQLAATLVDLKAGVRGSRHLRLSLQVVDRRSIVV